MKIFLSHSSRDKWAARWIAADIEALGATVFLDEKNIETGMSIDQAIQDHLHSSEHFLILLSPASVKSEWVMVELGGAIALDRHIVPILMYVGVNDIPKVISLRLARDISEIERYYEELKNALAPVSQKVRKPEEPPPTATRAAAAPKFKPGDVVRICATRPRSDAYSERLVFSWVPEMDRYLGQETTIRSPIPEGGYELEIDAGAFAWVEDWFVPVTRASKARG